tara:strand:+ start:3180 stop:3434 length:255 start_codon:yes stop_codon:yes gene_type:complete
VKPGDLVRYRASPPTKIPRRRVIPHDERPIGVIVEISSKTIGNNPDTQAYIEVIYVRWSEEKWNNSDGGLSEEYAGDLVIIQHL